MTILGSGSADLDQDQNEADPKHWFQFYISKTDDRVKHKGLYYYT